MKLKEGGDGVMPCKFDLKMIINLQNNKLINNQLIKNKLNKCKGKSHIETYMEMP